MTSHARRLAAALAAAFLLAACRPADPDAPPAADTEHAPDAADAPAWVAPLDAAIDGIEAGMPGEFGVYVRRLGADAGSLDRGDGRPWYLSSTIKVPVAIAVLEQVDAGDLSLDQELVLAESDFVDGAGDMLEQAPGDRFTIATLIEKSLVDSDSTATDMLIRLIGERHLDRRVRSWVGRGFEPITTILQVRYDAYGALHPGVAELSNMDLVRLRQAGDGNARLDALARRLGVERASLDAENIEAVFGRYYETGANSALLGSFADLLEQLVTGELLSPESTDLILGHMRSITTGTRRIQAGLPAGTDFAQKTGTQVGRACNVGVIDADRAAEGATTIVIACADDFGDIAQAEAAFQSLGRALADAGLAG